MNDKLKSEGLDSLFEGILKLNNLEECYSFFEDLCTINELHSLAQRLEVARKLKEGKTYIDIGVSTGASTVTISRVNRVLNYGTGGYNTILERLGE